MTFKYPEALDQGMGGYAREMSNKRPKISISFKIEDGIEKIVHNETADIDSAFAFLREPFVGRFYFCVDGEDIMPKIALRRSFPFAYVEWLAKNHGTYMNESKSGKTEEELNRHTFAYGLGDASPRIMMWRYWNTEIISPRDSKIKIVYAKHLSDEIKRISQSTLETLEKNPRFRGSERVAGLREQAASLELR